MYKKIFLLIIIINISLTINAQFEIRTFHEEPQSKHYFYEYEEDGLWGIKYQDEICLWPQFEGLISIDNGAFLYKENGLWGLMCPTKRFTTPIFEDCRIIIKYTKRYSYGLHKLILTKQNGKYGIIGITGEKFIENLYDSIVVYRFDEFLNKPRSPKWQAKNITYSSDFYFAALDRGKWNLLDLLGNVVYTDFIIDMGEKEKKSFGKKLEKYEIERAKTSKRLKVEINDKERTEFKTQQKLYGFFIEKRFNQEGLDFGDIENHIYETSFIDIPWLDNSIDAKLNRDSTNVFAWRNIFYESLPKLRKTYEFDETLDENMLQEEIDWCHQLIAFDNQFMQLIKNKGYSEESIIYQDALSISKCASQIIETNISGIKRVRKQKKLANVVNALEAIGSTLENVANTFSSDGCNNKTNALQPFFKSSTNINSNNTISKKAQQPYSISDNLNKNTDSRTYANYDAMLSKMRSGNIPYNDRERKKWQSEMKKLRLKWQQQGKSFPHSTNESWNGK